MQSCYDKARHHFSEGSSPKTNRVTISESKDSLEWRTTAAVNLSGHIGEAPVLAVYGIRAQPATPTATTQCSDELCECVSVALRGGVTSNNCFNIVSVVLSPTTRPQARLPAVEESQRMGAATQRAAKAEIKVEPEIITARLDTGATCHDFISQTTADALVARGANLEPTSGRVCSAFQGEEKSLSNRINIR